MNSDLNSKKLDDIAISTDGQLEITNIVDRLPRTELILDVKIVLWSPARVTRMPGGLLIAPGS